MRKRPRPERRESNRLPKDREQALFEAGIKLGGIFHQFIGVPVSSRTAASLERAIEAAVGLQPYVSSAKIVIRPGTLTRHHEGRFSYQYLTADMLSAEIIVVVGKARVKAILEFRDDLDYPLMRVT